MQNGGRQLYCSCWNPSAGEPIYRTIGSDDNGQHVHKHRWKIFKAQCILICFRPTRRSQLTRYSEPENNLNKVEVSIANNYNLIKLSIKSINISSTGSTILAQTANRELFTCSYMDIKSVTWHQKSRTWHPRFDYTGIIDPVPESWPEAIVFNRLQRTTAVSRCVSLQPSSPSASPLI